MSATASVERSEQLGVGGVLAQSPSHTIPGLDAYNGLRVAVGWPAFDLSALAAAFDRTLYFSCIHDGQQLIACGRAVGDGYCFAYLQDIMVQPRVQRQGFGTLVVQDLLNQVRKTLRTEGYCGLLAVKGTEEFYRRLGFGCQSETNSAMGFYVSASQKDGQI